MRIAVIACRVFTRELSPAAAHSQHTCELIWLSQGLHDVPDQLRTQLQTQIDLLEDAQQNIPAWRKLDAIALCYGLCGGGSCGLRAGKLPLIIPRTEDCIGLLLGAQQRYLNYFHNYSGIYWFSPGWLEYADTPSEQYYQAKYHTYITTYGEENAAWLLKQENSWISHYQNAFYIAPDALPNDTFAQQAKQVAAQFGWRYQFVQGSSFLLDQLLGGDWPEQHFLICPPGYQIAQTIDSERLIAVP